MDLQALNLQAMSALHHGELAKAESLIGQLGQARPGHPQVALLTGMLRALQGYHQEALSLLERVQPMRPTDASVLHYLGMALQGLGRFPDALDRYDAALALKPASAASLGNRGNVLTALGRWDEALTSYDAALAIRSRDEILWNNRGNLLIRLQRFDEAMADFEQALAIRPDFPQALDGKGNALLLLHRPAQALACFERALQYLPRELSFLMNRAAALTYLNRHGEALADFDRILAIDPQFPKLSGQIALMALLDCDWKRMDAIRPGLPAQVAAGVAGFDPWTLMGYGVDGATLLKCARTVVAAAYEPEPPALWTGQPYRHDRIRLAYVSPDFHDHPVGYQIAELLERHDRARFEIIAISVGQDDGSAIRARLRRACDQFHDLAGQSNAQIGQTLRRLEADIAVDLSGHTHGNRLDVFALRPAPVQASWLGHPGTTGAPFIDYLVGDSIVTPPEHQCFYSEKIVRLPNSFFPLDTTSRLGTCPTRAQEKLPDSGFVFCCFNRDWKINPAMFDIWLSLLDQTPGSVLWLRSYNGNASPRLTKRAAERGIDPSRLVFADQAPRDLHLARHALADLFLDTLPYGAHATAADALWSGLPVLTQLGDMFPGRVGASLLAAAGIPELITRSPGEYEAAALGLARDPARLQGIRERLAANRATAPLFDMARFARDLEAAYEKMLAEKT